MGVIIVILFICAVVLIEELYKRKPKTHGISGALDWHIRKGVLYINGEGPMENFSNSRRSPWHQNITGVEIGEGVTSIGNYAFSFCTKLTEAVIPHNIKSIGQYAFSYCLSIKEVEIQTSPDSIKIDSGVFPSGTVVKFTEKGRELHRYTVAEYEDDYAAEDFEEVYKPADETVVSAPQIQTAVQNESARTPEIADEEDNGMISWKVEKGVLTVSGSGPMKNFTAGNPAPWGKKITSAVIESGITSVGAHSFYNCSKLKSVVIPDTAVSIEDSAFAWCTALEAVDLPKGLTSIGKGAFSCCSKLSAIEIPEGVTSIPDDAFAYCDKLRGKIPVRQ